MRHYTMGRNVLLQRLSQCFCTQHLGERSSFRQALLAGAKHVWPRPHCGVACGTGCALPGFPPGAVSSEQLWPAQHPPDQIALGFAVPHQGRVQLGKAGLVSGDGFDWCVHVGIPQGADRAAYVARGVVKGTQRGAVDNRAESGKSSAQPAYSDPKQPSPTVDCCRICSVLRSCRSRRPRCSTSTP